MQSIEPNQRIVLVDALRGYALMGLFLIHMVEYFELYWYSPEPGPVNTAMFFLFGGKAYAMFALLFGVSFFIIMERQARRGVDFRARFVWRLAVLFGFGYIHGLIYGGDILQILAVTGLLLVPLYRARNITLLLISLLFILQGPALLIYAMTYWVPDFSYAQPLHATTHPLIFEVYANGSFMEVLRMNTWFGQFGKWAFMIESGRVWNIMGLSLLGFLLARIGFFTEVERYRFAYVKGFAVAVCLSIVFLVFGEELKLLARPSASNWMIGNIVDAYTNHALIAVTMLGLMLLYHVRVAGNALRLLAPCGRFSLTIYVSQAFLGVPFFYGYGAAAHTFIGQPLSLALGLVLWVLQVWLAHYWTKHYHYGPLEWLWRAATYVRVDVPFKRSAVGAVA